MHTLELPPGGVLVAYSDGVTEAMDEEGEELGEARLAHAVQRHRRSAPIICAARCWSSRAIIAAARPRRTT